VTVVKDTTWSPSAHQLSDIIVPPGLSIERQRYLYEKIREYYSYPTKDITCPKPSQPLLQ